MLQGQCLLKQAKIINFLTFYVVSTESFYIYFINVQQLCFCKFHNRTCKMISISLRRGVKDKEDSWVVLSFKFVTYLTFKD